MFTPDDVLRMGQLLGVEIQEHDALEVALRLSVTIAAIERISDPLIDSVDPLPAPASPPDAS